MFIRRAEARDIPSLNEIMFGSSAYAGEYRRILEGYDLTEDYLDRCHVWLADSDGGTQGFYSLVLEPEPELDLLFVADAAQGCGFGRRLFGHMRELARSLSVRRVKIVSHPPSEGFYLGQGAVRLGADPPRGRVSWTRPVLELAVG